MTARSRAFSTFWNYNNIFKNKKVIKENVNLKQQQSFLKVLLNKMANFAFLPKNLA
jgi:hypothetical protein